MTKRYSITSALWRQGDSATDPGFFVIDGVQSRYSDTDEQSAVITMMNTSPFKLERRHKEGDGTSPSFSIQKSKDLLYVEGNFNEKDDANRLRAFRFVTRLKQADDVISTLKDYAQKMSCTFFLEDLEEIRKTCNKNNKPLKLILICVMIATIMATIIVCLL